MTVVGVVGDIRHLGPAVPPRPEIYQAASQRSFSFMAFVVRTAGDPYAAVPTIRRAAAELDPSLPLANVKTMDDHIARALARPRFVSSLVTAFGALALTLALVGIYGMMSWAVSERRREFAIRVALGVRGSVLLALVLREGAWLALAGTVIGVVAARAAAGVLTGLLYGVHLRGRTRACRRRRVRHPRATCAARRSRHAAPIARLRLVTGPAGWCRGG
jgi:ABC-type antimicrobial peptide transport system permease subunit